MVRKMLKGYPGVARWEQTDDVLQTRCCGSTVRPKAVAPLTLRFFRLAAARSVANLSTWAPLLGPRGTVPTTPHSPGPSSPMARRPARASLPTPLRTWAIGVLDRVPPPDRESARRGSRSLRPALVPGVYAGRSRCGTGCHRADSQPEMESAVKSSTISSVAIFPNDLPGRKG